MAKRGRKKKVKNGVKQRAHKGGSSNLQNTDFSVYQFKVGQTVSKLRFPLAVLESGVRTVNGLAQQYDTVRKGRRGAPSHSEQDLLRSMVVMAGAALEATCTEIMKAGFPSLFESDDEVRKRLVSVLSREVGKYESDKFKSFLFETVAFAGRKPDLLSQWINAQAKESFQSEERIKDFMGWVGMNKVGTWRGLKAVFGVRNDIVHRMDVKPKKQRGRRGFSIRERVQAQEMHAHAKKLLQSAEQILVFVNNRLEKLAQNSQGD